MAKESWHLTPEEWKEILTPEEYRVLREKGTELPFTGEYNEMKKTGTYRCRACGMPLFNSDTKFDSGSGWPSFYKPVSDDHVILQEDHKLAKVRTEVLCKRCASHLGHVFEDGPKPTGMRYCVNSIALKFEEDE